MQEGHHHRSITITIPLLLITIMTSDQVNPWEYFINRERKFVWCNVFKSASSSWMYGFNNVAIR